MAYTADQIINAALRSLGVLAEGESPSSDTSADALMALNIMIDSWGLEKLATYVTSTQTFTWPAATQTLTFGPSGATVTGTRPVLVDDSTYYVYSNLSYQLELVNQQQYNSIVLKTATSSLPQVLFVNMDFPNISMSLYPVPLGALTFNLVSAAQLSQPATGGTTLSFPPGYNRAFLYCLAMEIASHFGIDPPKSVVKAAAEGKRNIKRINNPQDVMSLPTGVLPAPAGFNYFTGDPW